MFNEKPKLHKRIKKYLPGNLRTVSIDITNKCNMHCKHCYADTFRHAEIINIDALKSALNEIQKMGAYHFVLQGGEPLCDKNRLCEIVEWLSPEQCYINLVSNGWQMSRDAICFLKNLGIDKISYSLDSINQQPHDENRRAGSYVRVMQAIDDTIAEGLLCGISTVSTHGSTKLFTSEFWEMVQFAVNKQIRLDVQIAMPVGKWEGREELLIDKSDARNILALRLIASRLPNGQFVVNRDIYNYDGNHHCPAGTEFMAISADGHILPCNFCQVSLGKIGEISFQEAMNVLKKNKWFQQHPVCLVGESREYYDKHIKPYIGIQKPLKYEEVFLSDI